MLSRTADHLFWMARYMERAENTARMLDVSYQGSLLPQTPEEAVGSWSAVLNISELMPLFQKRFGAVSARNVMDFMVRDEDNPSSIFCCLHAARENARAVRGTLTTEVWETTNQTWLEFNRLLREGAFDGDPSNFFEWVKFRSHLSRGVTLGTMLQDDALNFIRLGTFLERGDNTARLLDVKFHALTGEFFGAQTQSQTQTQSQSNSQLQSQSQSQLQLQTPSQPLSAVHEPQEVDFYHWSAILRSVSGFEIYRKVYRNVIRPERVAELLILRPDMPRSLAACSQEMLANLRLVANEQSADTLRQAGRLKADLEYSRIDEILSGGLHAWLTRYLARVGELGAGISRDFLVPSAA